MIINGLRFKQTCSCCPEQYDVYDGEGNVVGYVRLRWGYLRCDYPDHEGETIYEADIIDGMAGCFGSDKQRIRHLTAISDAILRKMGETI